MVSLRRINVGFSPAKKISATLGRVQNWFDIVKPYAPASMTANKSPSFTSGNNRSLANWFIMKGFFWIYFFLSFFFSSFFSSFFWSFSILRWNSSITSFIVSANSSCDSEPFHCAMARARNSSRSPNALNCSCIFLSRTRCMYFCRSSQNVPQMLQ